MRLIDADKLDTRERGNNSQRTMWWHIKRIINNAPTIEAKLIVHAHWKPKEIYSKYFTDQFECSNCHCISINHLIIPRDEFEAEYCPHCGAQMDEREDDNG